MFQFPQGFRLNLANSLPRHVELLPNFLKRVVGVHSNSEAHPQDPLFPWGEGG